jgi:hypothetical protein
MFSFRNSHKDWAYQEENDEKWNYCPHNLDIDAFMKMLLALA